MVLKRKSGILLHITSLPGEFGIGDLGPGADRFVDFLASSKQRYWQILPINPTDAINEHSPYSSSSAFAGNILLISPQQLAADGFIDDADLANKPHFSEERVDFKKVEEYKLFLLDLAYDRFEQSDDFNKFKEDHSDWLNDYALFVTIKELMSGIGWAEWTSALRGREKGMLAEFERNHFDKIQRIKYFQFLFFKQWDRLKNYCTKKGIQLIGDLPIYVNFDSADVWANPQNYRLDEHFNLTAVSGVPPDYFSASGQRWGNPIYNWETIKTKKYDWWIERFRLNFQLFDIVRVDHFRGLVQYWEIPVDEQTAINGKWMDVPTVDFLQTLENCFSKPLNIIAEDLGHITEDVREVIRRFNVPGMKVLLFAFGDDKSRHPYLPHNYKERCVVYTGTHDNNTVIGWFKNEATQKELDHVKEYLGKEISDDSINWDLIQLAFDSSAEIAMIPMQDILGLGSEGRMNKPATMNGNWRWRYSSGMLTPEIIQTLSDLTGKTGRD